jgi:hypothetical protein
MKKVLGISLLLVVALTAMAFGKPVDQSHDGLLPELPILDGEQTQSSGVSNLSVGLFTDTVSYGGTWWAADSSRWEAIRDSCWTFETGVGSNLDNGTNPNKPDGYHQEMEGFFGIDQTLNPLAYFRVSNTCVINGGFSAWAGVTLTEANDLCYAGGQGYGNSWGMYFCKNFVYGGSGNITFSYNYAVECESGFDYAYVYIDSTGVGDPANAANEAIVLAAYTGTVSGSASFTLQPGVTLPSSAGSFNIWIAVTSDGSYSDEDGLNPTVCGHSAWDDLTLSGAVNDLTTFESGNANGWAQVIPVTGVGDYSHIASRADLPPPAVFCECAAQDSVLVFFDETFLHPLDQDNIAASPWINLRRGVNTADLGRPLRLMLYSVYAVMPIANYIFVQMRARYYPALCTATGLIYRTGWRDQNIVFYFGESPFCNALGTTQLRDYSAVIESSAEQIQLAFGMLNLCRTAPFGFPCTGVTNTTPWLDNLSLGIGGSATAPAVTLLTFDRLQDNFAQDGTLNPASTGRFDSNTIKDGSNPIPGTHLRDTLVARVGSSANTEVRFYFRVSRTGPFTNATSLSNYLGLLTPANFPGNPGWYCARMDTAEQGGTVSAGNYMLTFHESDPAFTALGGNDRTADPQDPNQLQKEILPDHLFTPGTRIDYFLASRYIPPDTRNVGGTNWFLETDTTGAVYREVEILPSSTTTDTTWNCVLYVDQHDDRSFAEQRLEEQGLTAKLGLGSANYETTNFDRFDNSTPSSGQLSLGRAIQTNYGCSAIQLFAYKTVAWHCATLSSVKLTDEDANILRPWLTIPEVGNNRFWGSGDGLVRSMSTSNEVSTVSFQQNILGVLATCNTVREVNCPTGSALDSTSCIPLNNVAGAAFANTVASSGQGNGCNALRSFDVNGVNTAVVTAKGQSSYTKNAAIVNNMSVTNHNTVDVDYRTVTDGVAVGALRNTTGTPNNLALCAANTAASLSRTSDVLTWFGSAALCGIPAAIVDVPGDIEGPKPPQFRHALGNAYPNPMNPVTRIQFTNGVENGRVSLEIFDVTGRLVKSLVNERMTAGVHEVQWDGSTDNGSSASSGMYFYKMTGEKDDNGAPFVSSKKLVIMK